MLKQIRIVTVIIVALTLYSQSIVAGDITTPFATGDTLTAARMEEIRDAINANMPVARCSNSVFSTGLTTTVSDITSVSVTVNGPGTVMVTGSTSLSVTSTGAVWEGDIYISDTSDTSNSNARRQWWVPAGMPNGSTATPAQVQTTFTVPSAGTYTYYLTGMHFYSTVVTANKSVICAVFTPD
ncbi:MAG: hypothetical protein OQL06_08365 [Gammaproteobacteria bacterium]|nr:hypothetical protein [Gammaproteobacteria bacterium]